MAAVRPGPGRARRGRACSLNPRRRRARSGGGSARARRSLASLARAASSVLLPSRPAAGAAPSGGSPMRQSPWKKAPSSTTQLGRDERRLRRGSPRAARSAAARAPCPLTRPRIETTPQSISASTCPVSPTIRVLSETIRPLARPSMRRVSRKRSSPENSVPSSRKPFRSSAERPLIFSMRCEPSTCSTGLARRAAAARRGG